MVPGGADGHTVLLSRLRRPDLSRFFHRSDPTRERLHLLCYQSSRGFIGEIAVLVEAIRAFWYQHLRL